MKHNNQYYLTNKHTFLLNRKKRKPFVFGYLQILIQSIFKKIKRF